ncbi:MAG TPA: cellulase family glycosylhydrolase, partial [Rhodopila sp.]|nr:cellulase family glycosylhydrolase [Rhodopila sp.]
GWRLETSAADRQALQDFWQTLSAALRPLNSAQIVPEVLNEPVFPGDPAGWARLQHAVLSVIRRHLPRSTVVLTGADWGSIGGLLALPAEADANVVYSFHFYEPPELTSLAAYRHDVDRKALAALPFPVAGTCPLPAADAATRDLIRYYCASGWDAERLRARIDTAAAWGRMHGVHLLAGEFGATAELNAVARRNWIRAVRGILDGDHVAWALWGYDDIMGFAVHRPPGRRPPLDPALLDALDLHTPM